MSDIDVPEIDEDFFDKDHIVFYTDESGDIKCRFAISELESFSDLILTVLSGTINNSIMDFLVENLDKQGLKEEALSMMMIKKLLGKDDSSPIVKPSNFK